MKNPRLATLSALLTAFPACGQPDGTPRGGTPNHLANEKSPYLQQHAVNPVDWYPWGEQAFAKAREENKPIFLSIGYSTCHWCHVMARESFSDPVIAGVMNESFINIKVDREERPDVDQVYMTFVQATTGSGGWPMSVWLTPDLKPFAGGTYFPPRDDDGRPGFKSVLEQLAAAWKKDEESIRSSAGSITERLRQVASRGSGAADELPDAGISNSALRQIAASYDPAYGGFGSAPKFPRPVTIHFLHHIAQREGPATDVGKEALAMSGGTLEKMADGGIYDHLGGGFHRYSVDRYWHIPHYEKMLYDQAQLVTAYLDAARLTGDVSHREAARETLAYVTRRMTSPEGGFYSAEDADSLKTSNAAHKTEGAFYIWEKQEIDLLLGDNAALFNYVFGVEPNGNAPDGSDPHGDLKGTNTLIRRHSDAAAAAKFNLPPARAAADLASSSGILLAAREKRPHPHLDDKILTAWNGLMISAYARAYQDLEDPAYRLAAVRAARFIKDELYDAKRGVLLRSYRAGPAAIDGFAADYAFLIDGLTALYQADFNIEWLEWADALQTKQDELFWDSEHGGYFASTGEDPNILLRSKEAYDGAEPSENSVSALNLLRLGSMLDQPERRANAAKLLRAFASQIEQSPTAAPQLLIALDAVRAKPAQIVIAGKADAPDTLALLKTVRAHAGPDHLVLLADGGAGQQFLGKHAAFYQSITPTDGKATAFVCENFVCQLPVTDPAALEKLLRGLEER
ncbi:MAG: thioredoxin domain-containing protein [Akkermansiaceae bacterium]|nr:thioredoxin domain-containing protein [Akkermansiaceae bacterium]